MKLAIMCILFLLGFVAAAMAETGPAAEATATSAPAASAIITMLSIMAASILGNLIQFLKGKACGKRIDGMMTSLWEGCEAGEALVGLWRKPGKKQAEKAVAELADVTLIAKSALDKLRKK